MRPTAKMLADGTVLVLCRGRCGRTLTDPESIARGYGPVCWDRLPVEAQAAIAETLLPKPAAPRIPRGRRSHRLETRTEAQLTVADIAGIAPDWTGDQTGVEFVRRQRDTVAIPTQPTTTPRPDMNDHDTLANTIRALELLADSHTAWEARDKERCDALIAQANEECGADTVVLIQGGMRIGEIPSPDSEHWHEYLQHQRDRLARMGGDDA